MSSISNELNSKVYTVSTLAVLKQEKNEGINKCIYCEETKKFYGYNKETEEWEEIKFNLTNNEGLAFNLYDLNKQIMLQLPALSNKQIAARMSICNDLFKSAKNSYYMLLCKDFNYYTIFAFDPEKIMPAFDAAVCEIVSSLGEVVSIEFVEDKTAIEIWIRPTGEEAYAFYLFPYDAGVVYYG